MQNCICSNFNMDCKKISSLSTLPVSLDGQFDWIKRLQEARWILGHYIHGGFIPRGSWLSVLLGGTAQMEVGPWAAGYLSLLCCLTAMK